MKVKDINIMRFLDSFLPLQKATNIIHRALEDYRKKANEVKPPPSNWDPEKYQELVESDDDTETNKSDARGGGAGSARGGSRSRSRSASRTKSDSQHRFIDDSAVRWPFCFPSELFCLHGILLPLQAISQINLSLSSQLSLIHSVIERSYHKTLFYWIILSQSSFCKEINSLLDHFVLKSVNKSFCH